MASHENLDVHFENTKILAVARIRIGMEENGNPEINTRKLLHLHNE